MQVTWRATSLQLLILTVISAFGCSMCEYSEVFTPVEADSGICESATAVSSAQSDAECAVACTGNSTCRSFGYATPFVEGSCLASEMDNCTLITGGKTFRKMPKASSSASGTMATGSTVMFMQRHIGDVDFAKPWSDYEDGFGNFGTGDFWLGLRNIKALLGPNSATWRVEMKLWYDDIIYVEHNDFTLGDASTNYWMNFSALGDRSPDITTSRFSNNAAFSTMDRDNDNWAGESCSEYVNGNGGFWFRFCGGVFPTAAFPTSPADSVYGFMSWYISDEYWEPIKEIRMYLKR